MWTSLVLAALLGGLPGQSDHLELARVRATYGVRGAPRPDNKYLPGDTCVVTFDIEGIAADANGKVLYSMATEVVDGKGKAQFKQAAKDLEGVAALGGKRLPAFAQVDLGLNQPEGKYSLKVTVTDRKSQQTQTLTHEFEVLPRDFGIVRLSTTTDPDGVGGSSIFSSGDLIWVNTGIVGFARDPGTSQPRIVLELQVKDEEGNPTTAKPFSGEVSKDVPANARAIPSQFVLFLNRPGKFTAHVKATDKVSNKSATLSFPLNVVEAK